MKSIRLFFIIAFIFIYTNLEANNISIANITSVTGSGYVQLQFDLSWDNSWYNSINHDAAWVFFKFKDNDGTWRHLNLTNANNSIAANYTITVPGDKTGAFIYRSVTGTGTVTLTGVRVGVNNLPGNFDIRAFALEMVQIPLGDAYYLGDGTSGFNGLSYTAGGPPGTVLPFLVNANSITMGTSSGQLNDNIQNGVLDPNYPIGFTLQGSLYMMKHEVSQGAYRDFLNTLTYTQQVTRTANAPNSVAGTEAIGTIIDRNGIQIMTPGVNNGTPAVYGCNLNNNGTYNEATDGEWIACNYLNYMDIAAFLDWAALRPMTEMEFEKSCRGTVYPVSGENAAGTAAAASSAYPISNSGAANEAVTSYSGSVLNANITNIYTSPQKVPLRVGIHATQYATRISAGAGYYGCLDLSGNVEEVTVASGNNAGRSYQGNSGDGTLTASGDANVNYWPGINGNNTSSSPNLAYGGTIGVTAEAGIFRRGGTYDDPTGNVFINVSSRSNSIGILGRNRFTGGRGVKSF